MKIKQEVFKGFFIGVLTSVLGVIICTLLISSIKSSEFTMTFQGFVNEGNLWMLLALGALPNLGVFFFLLQKDLEYKARGVVLATLLVAFITYAIYFI
ncbi:MAG: hypothetical protein ACPGU9_04060 [Flavobacteriaceae bacterium]